MRYTTETFIKKLKEKIGNDYDYSLVNYTNNKEDVTLICKVHGVFKKKASLLLHGNRGKGSGCSICGANIRREKIVNRNERGRNTQNNFIERAKYKHGDKYDYSLVIYTGLRHKVKIICNNHGVFEQMAQAHIVNGQGCPTCFKITKSNKIAYDMSGGTESFSTLAKRIHGDIYDYSKVDLSIRGPHGEVSIECKKHGTFSVAPSAHLRQKQGCAQCSYDRKRNSMTGKLKMSNEDFVTRAISVHGQKYSYDLTEFKGVSRQVNIECKAHGMFTQRASDHLSGNGCQKCANYATSKMENDWLDKLEVSIRQKKIICGKKRFIVDGFDPNTNTIYEFLGDFWHGNPKKYNRNDQNPVNKKKYGKLYDDTFERFDYLINEGYSVKYIWESEWCENNLRIR